MIITKTPLRMSYVGGGSDLPSYYKKFGGAVISTSVKKYVYIIVKERFEKGVRISYSSTENVANYRDIKHPLVRHCLSMLNIEDNIEIVSISDIPSSGTGLGSSSSFSVGLIKALTAFKGKVISTAKCAELACKLEIELCGSPIGKQDQYAASFGGLKVYNFNEDDSVSIQSVKCNLDTIRRLDEQTLAFYVGGKRSANKILQLQSTELKKEKKLKNMSKMIALVWDLKNELEAQSVENFGAILHENWLLKRAMSDGISNSYIDDIYNEGIESGATGGKLLGAGGGGFMIFHAPSKKVRDEIRARLFKIREVNLNLEPDGSSILHYR